jgi:hypothetical protein
MRSVQLSLAVSLLVAVLVPLLTLSVYAATILASAFIAP